jgi:hypothetical protein
MTNGFIRRAIGIRFSIRHLLILTTLCGLLLAGYVRYRHLEEHAQEHLRQAQEVARRRGWLLTVSFHVPQEAWDDYDRREHLHQRLAAEYRQQIWRPWMEITQPEPPLPMIVDNRPSAAP